MPHLYALSSNEPLTKTIERTPTGITKTPYPMVALFSSHAFSYTNLGDFATHARAISARNWCLIKGSLLRELRTESRAGNTNADTPTSWVCLDFDGVKADSIDTLLSALGLNDCSHLVQYSSSHGLVPGVISAHVFMLLDQEVSPRVLKEWLQKLNLQAYRDQITLNRIGTALRWPLDITTCQNDKLLYIAAPVFQGMDDPMTERWLQVDRINPAIPTRRIAVDFADVTRERNELLHELRKKAGLPKIRDTAYKVLNGQEYLAKPGQFTLTGVKEARGFRYFNFNGGDSWAYFQPLDDFEFVRNFKGEPAYLLSDIAPEYYASVVQQLRQEIRVHTDFFSFISPVDDTIYNAVLDKKTNDLSLYTCSTERRAHTFLKGNGMPTPEELPLMDIVYDPTRDYVVDHAERLVNIYKPPQLVFREDVREIPPMIRYVITHAVGENELFEAFLKWVRYVSIQRGHSAMAWALSGEEGTGKGVLFHRILTPLVGASNATLVPMTALVDSFNGWMEDKLLVGVDEVQFSALGRDASLVESKMKTWITEPITQVRKMHSNSRPIVNRTNWLLMSNKPNSAILSTGDRRHQVGRYQANKITLTSENIAEVDASIDAFYSWLVNQAEVPSNEVRAIVDHHDRRLLIDLSLTTIDSVARRLLNGDIEFLFMQIDPGVRTYANGGIGFEEVLAYKRALLQITLRAINQPESAYITRDELYNIINYLAGNVRKSPHHFTSLLKHYRVYLQQLTPAGRPCYCMHVTWQPRTVEWYRAAIATYLQDVLNDVPAYHAAA